MEVQIGKKICLTEEINFFFFSFFTRLDTRLENLLAIVLMLIWSALV